MSTKGTITTIIIDVCVIFLIITIPISVLLLGFSNYGMINESLTFYYLPNTPSPIEELYLNVDKGNIVVQYDITPTECYAKVEVNVEMHGSNVAGKSYLDYFDIVWQNTSTPITFIMEYKPDICDESSTLIFKFINVIVTLKPDIVFDINVFITNGNFDISVPFNVLVDDIKVATTTGNITLDFNQCFIGGDITSTVNTGNIELTTYNVEYARDCSWTLITEPGDINMEIQQYKDMGANVTGIMTTAIGAINLVYRDNTGKIGAIFTTLPWGPWTDPDWWLIKGFEREALYEGFERVGYLCTSYDFPAKNNYNFSLRIQNPELAGVYNLDILSV